MKNSRVIKLANILSKVSCCINDVYFNVSVSVAHSMSSVNILFTTQHVFGR